VAGRGPLQYVFGSVLTFLFMQQVVLGILLAFYYSPSASDAWASTAYLNDQVSAGGSCAGCITTGRRRWWWSVVLHLLQVVWAGAYRAPREVNWWTGLAMGGLVLAFALTGYLLPWDQKGYWATQVATGIMGSVPGGEPLQQVIQGGPEYGNLTITRFYALHVFVLPLTLAGLLAAHMALFRRHGVTPPARLSEAELKRKTQPFWPNQLFLDVVAMAVCGAALVGLTVPDARRRAVRAGGPGEQLRGAAGVVLPVPVPAAQVLRGAAADHGDGAAAGAVTVMLFLLPWIDRATSRKAKRPLAGADAGRAADGGA
jgi:ubiquinol-cytochrome c reductase cytochrome b subunit